MAAAFLRRFDITACRSKSATDSTQAAIPLALINFFRQGATLSGGPVTIGNGSSAAVDVYDTGRLVSGDTIVAGLGGPSLAVTSVDYDAQQVTLQNNSGSSVTIPAGARLIPITDRPTVYADPYGTVSLGNSIAADANGHAVCYIDEKRFDYSMPASPVGFDHASSQTLTGEDTSMSWEHIASGSNRAVLVGVSWQDALGEESVTGVMYGGIAMTMLATSGLVQLFALVDPPPGASNIVVSWSGNNFKGAVAGAVSLANVHPSTAFGAAQTAQGSSNAPSVQVPNTDPLGLVLDTVGVACGSTTTTLTAGSQQLARWNASAGTAGSATLTLGGGSCEAGTGSSVTMSWTLGASKLWRIAAVEVKPLPARLVIDAEGSELARSPIAVNAADYPTIQAAIDACPGGGSVYIPAGEWDLSQHGENGTLVVRQAQHALGLTLFGDGWGTRLYTTDVDADGIRIEKTGSGWMGNFVLRDLRIEGVDNGPGTGRLLYLGTVASITVQNVHFLYSAAYALYAYQVSYLSCIDCHFSEGSGSGIRISWSNQVYCLGCTVLQFDDWCFTADGGGGYALVGGEYSLPHGSSAGKQTTDAGVHFGNVDGLTVIRVDMEEFARSDRIPHTGMTLTQCRGAVVDSGSMTGALAGETEDSVGIRVEDCEGIRIGPHTWRNTETAIYISDDCTGIAIEPQALLAGTGQLLPQPTKAINLPAELWGVANGAPGLSAKGTYPNTMVSYSFEDAPATGPQAIGLTVEVPRDYISGTEIKARIVWAPGTGAPALNKSWVGRLHYRTCADGFLYDGSEDGVLSQVFYYWGGEESGPDPSGPHAVVTQEWESRIPSTDLAPGAILRLAFDRLTTDANDDFPNDIEVFAILLDYCAYS